MGISYWTHGKVNTTEVSDYINNTLELDPELKKRISVKVHYPVTTTEANSRVATFCSTTDFDGFYYKDKNGNVFKVDVDFAPHQRDEIETLVLVTILMGQEYLFDEEHRHYFPLVALDEEDSYESNVGNVDLADALRDSSLSQSEVVSIIHSMHQPQLASDYALDIFQRLKLTNTMRLPENDMMIESPGLTAIPDELMQELEPLKRVQNIKVHINASKLNPIQREYCEPGITPTVGDYGAMEGLTYSTEEMEYHAFFFIAPTPEEDAVLRARAKEIFIQPEA